MTFPEDTLQILNSVLVLFTSQLAVSVGGVTKEESRDLIPQTGMETESGMNGLLR